MKATRLPILLAALALPLHAQTAADVNYAAIPATPGFPAAADLADADSEPAGIDAADMAVTFAGVASDDATAGVAGSLTAPVILQMAEQSVLAEPGPHAFLGLATTKPSRDLADHLGIAKNTGLVVAAVSPDSPAAKAGLKQGDLITKLDDQILINPEQMLVLVTNRKKDDVVKVSFLRHGETKSVDATLAEREGGDISASPAFQAISRVGLASGVGATGFGGGFRGQQPSNNFPLPPGTPLPPGAMTMPGNPPGTIGGAVYSVDGEPGKPLRTIIRRLKFDGKQATEDAATALAEIRKQLDSKENQEAIAGEVAKITEKSKEAREKIEKELRELTERLKALDNDSADQK